MVLLLPELIFRRPKFLTSEDVGVPDLEDLACAFHDFPEGKSALRSAAPLLAGLIETFAPWPLNWRATLCACLRL